MSTKILNFFTIGNIKLFKYINGLISNSKGKKRKTIGIILSSLIVFFIGIFELILICFFLSSYNVPYASDFMQDSGIKYMFGKSDFDGGLLLNEYYKPNTSHNITLSIISQKDAVVNIVLFSKPQNSKEENLIFLYERFKQLSKGNNDINIKVITPKVETTQDTCLIVEDQYNSQNNVLRCGKLLNTCINCLNIPYNFS